jgi:hypothetical protein
MPPKQKQKITQPRNPHFLFFRTSASALAPLLQSLLLLISPFGVVSAWFWKILYIGNGDLSHGATYGYVLDDCYHSRDIVGSGFLCFTWRRRIDTYTASDCRDCNSISTVDWKTYLDWRQKIVRMLI